MHIVYKTHQYLQSYGCLKKTKVCHTHRVNCLQTQLENQSVYRVTIVATEGSDSGSSYYSNFRELSLNL